ncbi:hypothetical protein [Tautonia rosea]|uniref:hypothetical protein n=1 Tax=Tautonia rosea TaxID=2728037 RepID=UPI001474696C|nr:hypothetical protein [Tautonia rosea]
MKKYHRISMDQHSGPPRKSKGWGILLLVGLLTMPLLWDGAKVSYAQWQTMFGPKPMVSTPTFDLLSDYFNHTTGTIRRVTRQPFRKVPWRVEWAVSGLGLSLAAGALILRYGRAR